MAFDPHATSFSMANAQILGQASAMAYKDRARCEKWAHGIGFGGPFAFFDNKDTQGFVAESGAAILVAFRGTQPNRAMDWFVDAGAVHHEWDNKVGAVHRGFYQALHAVWGVALAGGEVLPHRLKNRGDKTIWITGHSLGGALAELCAAKALLAGIRVQGVYTFGQPRVGNKAFADAIGAEIGSGIYRFVNHRDIVPRVPLFTAGWCHYGSQTFFDADGKPSEQESAVETLKVALKFGAVAFNLGLIKEGIGILKAGIKKALDTDDPTEDDEQEFRETARAILMLGAEKITDHNMEEQYLVRLGTKLPAE